MTNHLWKEIQSLSVFPHRYPVYTHRNDPQKTVRAMPVPPFIVFYRIDEDQHIARIATVRHGYRRPPHI